MRTAVLGVDGFSGGWVVVGLSASGRLTRTGVVEPFSELTGLDVDVIGVDIPIGCPVSPPRSCDTEARRLLGPRRSSVFATPPLDVLEAATYGEARRVSVERYGVGVSAQAYRLRDKILEVAEIAGSDRRVVEIHPELAFMELAGAPLTASKKTWDGFMARLALLAKEGIDLAEVVAPGAAPDDVVDAAAVAWSALRVRQGRATVLGDELGTISY